MGNRIKPAGVSDRMMQCRAELAEALSKTLAEIGDEMCDKYEINYELWLTTLVTALTANLSAAFTASLDLPDEEDGAVEMRVREGIIRVIKREFMRHRPNTRD